MVSSCRVSGAYSLLEIENVIHQRTAYEKLRNRKTSSSSHWSSCDVWCRIVVGAGEREAILFLAFAYFIEIVSSFGEQIEENSINNGTSVSLIDLVLVGCVWTLGWVSSHAYTRAARGKMSASIRYIYFPISERINLFQSVRVLSNRGALSCVLRMTIFYGR